MRLHGVIVLGVLAALTVVGCGSTPPSAEIEPVEGRIVVGPNLNPNAEGRPSPVYLRIYQLADSVPFTSASFEELADRDREILGASLISRDEFELCPLETAGAVGAGQARSRCQGEVLPVTLDVRGDTRYLAVMGEFYDLHDPSGSWRAVTEIPEEGLLGLFGSREFVVDVRRATVAVRFE
ncbi:type VI secretion system lipoprotein TssJ [Sediminicurvatus halobius]|uniref:Type VI secretion system lipoprotein TssJ n=1 Tax=Sediminicurvatus halobius TaxID=2182432 RepID=A0A2U2N2Q4_9GAMM|nr:type VI secretion system lipoprotein TssJ [Spiribacter halobius]PWG63269.1 type VI secretion system lipoprotein TssJ [Spiribacter halobius]UEX76658.1 type VI secretion system lipoprotein TssJ [Spiribacter halobius]